MCTRIERNYDVPDFLKANSEQYGFMLDRDPPNANFRDYDPIAQKLMLDESEGKADVSR